VRRARWSPSTWTGTRWVEGTIVHETGRCYQVEFEAMSVWVLRDLQQPLRDHEQRSRRAATRWLAGTKERKPGTILQRCLSPFVEEVAQCFGRGFQALPKPQPSVEELDTAERKSEGGRPESVCGHEGCEPGPPCQH